MILEKGFIWAQIHRKVKNLLYMTTVLCFMRFKPDKEWLFFVLQNRGLLKDIKGSVFYDHYSHLADNKDIIIGPIADDSYAACIKSLIRNDITIEAAIYSFSTNNYGLQYVAKNSNACNCLHILEEKYPTPEELLKIERRAATNRKIGYQAYIRGRDMYRNGELFSEYIERYAKEKQRR